MNIRFFEDPLDTMILSAVEKYKSEVIGVLFGRQSRGEFVVTMEVPLVTAETKFTWADYNKQRVNQIISLYPELTSKRRKFLGFYHSHTQHGDIRAFPQMSEDDRKSFSDTEEASIEIILAMNDYLRFVEWDENQDGTVSGTCAD